MVTPARRRRAWILLLIVWAVIAGVVIARYAGARRDAAAKLDREAAEQAALRAMNNMPPAEPATAPTEPPAPAADPSPAKPLTETPAAPRPGG